jgi:EAL domain-containing protein (putative c-di-GMP-specific phosphodiesterase class I)
MTVSPARARESPRQGSGNICWEAGLSKACCWRRGTEIVTPGRFLPIAEESLLISAISQQLLQELATVHGKLALPAFITFNWAPAQLAGPTANAALINRVNDRELEPDRIVIEITERSALIDPQLARRHVLRLKELGFRVALDEFASGYCSPMSLVRLPVNRIKIDVSLIREVGRCPRAAVVLRGIVELGRQTVAEGAESRLQLAFLRDLGCQLAQGHFIGRPVRELSA